MNVLSKKMRQYRQNERQASDLSLDFLKFVDLVAVCKLNEVCGFGGKRLQDYYKDSYKLLTDSMEKYGGDGDSEYEQILLCKEAYHQQLKAIGFDVKAKDEEILNNYQHIRTSGRLTAQQWRGWKIRTDFVTSCDDTIQVFFMSVLMYMHHHHKYGAARLERLYTAMRDEYIKMVDHFLSFEDVYVISRINEMRVYLKAKCDIEVSYEKINQI